MEEVPPPSNTKETQDFVVWLDGAPKEPLRQASEAQIRAALTALILAAEEASGIDTVSNTVIFFRRDGKPIYSYTPRLTANPSVLRALPAATIDSVSDWYQGISRDQGLERVSRLLVSSLQSKGDTLRSFLSAWMAMEIFTNKMFKSHKEQFSEELIEGAYSRFMDKFHLIASQLCPEDADEDFRQLHRAKKLRDRLLHGEEIDEAGLPICSVQELTRKYLRLHLAS